jgi:hypothetical protein
MIEAIPGHGSCEATDWYAVHTRHQHEKSAAEQFLSHAADRPRGATTGSGRCSGVPLIREEESERERVAALD